MKEWNIKKGGDACNRCERILDQGELYFSVLEVGQSEIQRVDYCKACFDGQPLEERSVFWRTKKIWSEPAKKVVNFEVLREVFIKMLDVEDNAFKEMSYLIALVLIRKRYLKLKDFVSEGGRDYMAVRQRKGEPLIKVEVPLISEEDILRLRDRLSSLLDADLDAEMDVKDLEERICTSPEPESPPEDPQEAD
ncbi:MAG: hypothetical protein ACYTG7_05710 [Planctomycetota bacterium]|jgi:hypothetical protein